MERLHTLLFELSSAERIRIMLELQESRLKLSYLSRKLDITLTEASRHLQRLNDASLIQKDSNGYFELTPFGKVALSLLSGINFVLKNRKYFLEYDASRIPYELVERIGELEGVEYITESFRNLEEGEKKIQEAQEFVWILSDQVLTSTIAPLIEKAKTPFDLRIILPEGKFPPENKSQLPLTTLSIKKRVLPEVDILTVLTEKYAVFCLPNRSGRIDYTGFAGNNPKFHKWCNDLFLYYWRKARPTNLAKIDP